MTSFLRITRISADWFKPRVLIWSTSELMWATFTLFSRRAEVWPFVVRELSQRFQSENNRLWLQVAKKKLRWIFYKIIKLRIHAEYNADLCFVCSEFGSFVTCYWVYQFRVRVWRNIFRLSCFHIKVSLKTFSFCREFAEKIWKKFLLSLDFTVASSRRISWNLKQFHFYRKPLAFMGCNHRYVISLFLTAQTAWSNNQHTHRRVSVRLFFSIMCRDKAELNW